MGLKYEDLDEVTRAAMVREIEQDVQNDTVYISNYLNDDGKREWVRLLKEAAIGGTDDTLAEALRSGGYLRSQAERRTKNGTIMVKVPYTAHETMGEGEFSRYYARGLCLRAVEEGISELEVYRAKEVRDPRRGSEEKIGDRVDPNAILDDLRKTQGVEPALGIPPGPNSGLTLRIPR